jgi:hypothetical protein
VELTGCHKVHYLVDAVGGGDKITCALKDEDDGLAQVEVVFDKNDG